MESSEINIVFVGCRKGAWDDDADFSVGSSVAMGILDVSAIG